MSALQSFWCCFLLGAIKSDINFSLYSYIIIEMRTRKIKFFDDIWLWNTILFNCYVIHWKYKLVHFFCHHLRYGYDVEQGSKSYCLEWGCVKVININHLYGLPSNDMENTSAMNVKERLCYTLNFIFLQIYLNQFLFELYLLLLLWHCMPNNEIATESI